MSYIEIRNLTKNISKRTVLQNINCDIEKGKIYGFLGHNGSGKTSYLDVFVILYFQLLDV